MGVLVDQEYQIVTYTNGTIVNASGHVYIFNEGEYYLTIRMTDAAILTSNFPILLIEMGQVCVSS